MLFTKMPIKNDPARNLLIPILHNGMDSIYIIIMVSFSVLFDLLFADNQLLHNYIPTSFLYFIIL